MSTIWYGERMNEDGRPDGLQAWADLSEATALLRSTVNRALQQRAGLSLAENLVLCQVAMAPGERLRMVEIADLLSIGKSAVTKTVDRLEEREWVSRHRGGDDRRSVHATLTATGAVVFARAQPVFSDAVLSQLCGPLTGAEVRELRRLLGKLLPPVRSRSGDGPLAVDSPAIRPRAMGAGGRGGDQVT